MGKRFLNFWNRFRASVDGMDSSRQLAAGVSLGMIIGLIPKDSLLAYLFIGILMVSRANLLSAFCAAMAGYWLTGLLSPVTHQIGLQILSFEAFEPLFSRLMQLPVVGWTRFENTVVMGSLVLGMAAAIPIFRISEIFFDAYGKSVFDAVRNTLIVRWLVGPPKQGGPRKPKLSEG